MSDSVGSNDTTDNPWSVLRRIGENLRAAYAPPEGQAARCDIELLLKTTTAARLALEGEGSPSGKAAHFILAALEKTCRGLLVDLCELAEVAGELAEDVSRLRGPV